MLIASLFAYDGDFAGWHRFGPVALAVVPAVLMATSYRFTPFRWLASPRRARLWVTVVAVVVLVGGLVFVPVADMGLLYTVSAVVLGGVFTFQSVRLKGDPSPERAMGLFHWSITYISLLFGIMAVDPLLT